MADIGESARMNPGHIYYYFSSKDDLITAATESALAEVLDSYEKALAEEGTPGAAVETSCEAVIACVRRGDPRLLLEILAESARNRRVAVLVWALDERIRARSCRVLGDAAGNGEARTTRVSVRYDVLSALVSGLALRSVLGVRADECLLRKELKDVLARLFQAELGGTPPGGEALHRI